MVEQVKSVDYRSHRAARVTSAPADLVDEVLALLDASLF
jgi:hypothetical protein